MGQESVTCFLPKTQMAGALTEVTRTESGGGQSPAGKPGALRPRGSELWPTELPDAHDALQQQT